MNGFEGRVAFMTAGTVWLEDRKRFPVDLLIESHTGMLRNSDTVWCVIEDGEIVKACKKFTDVTEVVTATMESFNAAKGWGFAVEADGTKYYVHRDSVDKIFRKRLNVGQLLQFTWKPPMPGSKGSNYRKAVASWVVGPQPDPIVDCVPNNNKSPPSPSIDQRTSPLIDTSQDTEFQQTQIRRPTMPLHLIAPQFQHRILQVVEYDEDLMKCGTIADKFGLESELHYIHGANEVARSWADDSEEMDFSKDIYGRY